MKNKTGFQLHSPFQPSGDQPQAIAKICKSFTESNMKDHTLLGVTGSGKTFTMAHVIAKLGKPALIIAPNKTLAAQLYTELKEFFPKNPVGFFISYYDYYQPEAYVPSTDTYIEKDSSINEDIDKMRHETTRSLFEDKHTIIIASVSCIYGLGSPGAYSQLIVAIKVGDTISRDKFLRSLVGIQYMRNDMNLTRGHFRVRGDVVDILPAHQADEAIRVEFFGDEVETLATIDVLTGKVIENIQEVSLYPNSHYVTDQKDIKGIVGQILKDLGIRLRQLKKENKLVEHQRLEQKTMQDVETLEQLGFCSGIENYSRYLTGKNSGEPPPCLLDYFPHDFLTIIDESHMTLPQIRGMYRGDRARKTTLVEYGFRLPSALDNRPLNFDEFMERTHQRLYVSATPGGYELEISGDNISEQIIRPTGLVDPPIDIRPVEKQVDDLFGAIKETIAKQGRVLITTLTKKMAEDLCTYYQDLGIAVSYLHADIQALERSHLLRTFRMGEFDVLIGINLLREGLDLPEVKLVAVMDADKEGFLRSHTSLIQIAGRAARNHEAQIIFYADRKTQSIEETLKETSRRREIQLAYNKKHQITPKTVERKIPEDLRVIYGLVGKEETITDNPKEELFAKFNIQSRKDLDKIIKAKSQLMKKLSGQLDFEKAATIRDEIKELKGLYFYYGEDDVRA